MNRKSKSFWLAFGFAVMAPAFAANQSFQVATIGCAGTTVTLSVHNPNPTSLTGRVSVTVPLNSGESVTLTSGNLTVAPGGTTQVVLNSPAPVKVIEDDAEPM